MIQNFQKKVKGIWITILKNNGPLGEQADWIKMRVSPFHLAVNKNCF